jgi:hypothetical protein
MDIEQVLHDYRNGDEEKRLSLFLFYREFRDEFSRIDDQDTTVDQPSAHLRRAPGKYALTLLRLSFLVGALTDGLAVVPMAHPAVGAALFGGDLERLGVEYGFAMAIGASLMAGWTLLLLWGYRKPVERRGVLIFTLFPAMTGIISATVYGVTRHVILLDRAIPLWIHLGLLSALFAVSYVLGCAYAGSEADKYAGQSR